MSFLRQTSPLNPDPAVWCARDVIGDEPFAVMLPDAIIGAPRPALDQLTDAMARLMLSQDFHALEYEGITHDCSDKIGLLRANVALALKRPDLKDAARAVLRPLLQP